MKIFVDTNIFIDILLGREPFYRPSARIYRLVENGLIRGYIAPITVNNIYYICRKAKKREEIKAFLEEIASTFSIAPLDADTIRRANRMKMGDYEDALQYAMAQQKICDILITRNIGDFPQNGPVRIMTPELFLETIETRL